MELTKNTRVRFDELTHRYLLFEEDGGMRLLKGVTTLMREHGLSPDYSGIDPEVLRRAAERGTAVHHLLEDYDGGKPVTDTPELKAYRRLKLNVIASEYLVSDNEMIASSIDKVIYVDGSTVDLGDVKTTSELHTDAVAWQLSIYKHLFEAQNPGIRVRSLYGIHVRDGRAKIVQVAPVPPERVAELLRCERDGVRLSPQDTPDVTGILTPDETDSLISYSLRIDELKNTIKELECVRAAYCEKVAAYMEANHIPELEANGCVIKLKAAYDTERLDSKRLKENDPDLYAKYAKTSRVKASLIIKNK